MKSKLNLDKAQIKKPTNVISMWLNDVQNIDCIEGTKKLLDNSVDLVIADPPYNLSKGNTWSWDRSVKLEGFGGPWKKTMEKWDNMSLKEYWDFTRTWLTETKRVLKPTGSIWVYGTYHNIGIINTLFQILGIEIINEIIWYKRNAFPNLSGRRFTASHETLLWGHAGGRQRKYFFDYKEMKNKDFPEDLLKKKGKQMRTVWDIPNNKTPEEIKLGTHPTQKPIKLCKRIILATSRQSDLILIPFCGSGSECIAAKMLGRNFISFEIDPQHVDVAKKRLAGIESKSKILEVCDD